VRDCMEEIIDDGDDWRIKIKESDKIFARKVGTQKNTNIKVDVAVDMKDVNGKKTIDVSVANVYYPKSKYSREDIEAKLDDIVKKATDPSCPLCQRFKSALSVEERKTILDDLMLPKPEMFTPRTVSAPMIDALGDVIDSSMRAFELLVPGIDDLRKKSSSSK